MTLNSREFAFSPQLRMTHTTRDQVKEERRGMETRQSTF